MNYLTYDEYKEISGHLKEEEFEKYISRAQFIVDTATNFFFVSHEIDDPINSNNALIVKRAIAVQLDFIKDTGITSMAQVGQGNLKSISQGHTSMSYDSDLSKIMDINTGLCFPAKILLLNTGLLGRVVDWY